ncbi:hypothetical protein K504DRAFT_458058 [Pleomassaria siparia CBS 279.74]|uniref:Uncharacterized protein n=1 Tax=Pleomassaria siparia CBS 279.74 TaxID=1314801 RepID=A0A6G1K5B8_9PLEO|nr:hypothetical protein K504DRAFT_458058 [Pleomassaria siparia CBS 279.74]
MPEPSSIDDALLARLNALKKSSVSFDTTRHSSITPSRSTTTTITTTSASIPTTSPIPTDSLAARFARLGSASPSSSSSPKPSRTTSTAPAIAPGAPSYLEGVAEGIGNSGEGGDGGGGGGGETQLNEEDERSLEELLAELGDRGTWDVERDEERDVGRLLRDVRRVLPEVQEARQDGGEERRPLSGKRKDGRSENRGGREDLPDWENVEVDIGSGGVQVGKGGDASEADDETGQEKKKKKPTEDEEAEDVIARIMAELSIDKKYGMASDDQEGQSDVGDDKCDSREAQTTTSKDDEDDDDDDGDEGGISLPSAPTSLPSPSPSPSQPTAPRTETRSVDDTLASRFASLSSPSPSPAPRTDSLGLPSAPSFHPSAKPPKISSSVKHTDEEIDTWCVICNDDARLKCLGCEGDLYCQNCWMEGHRGEDAGFEERTHKAVLYSKKKKKKKQFAAATG